MTREDFQAVAWSDFLRYAISDKDLLNAFTQDTGRQLSTATSRLDAMIDEATGKDADDMMAFVIWATETLWGWDESPASFRKDAEAWKRKNASAS